MIVAAIIGVLASIAVPRYQDYLVRAKIVEGLLFVHPCKNSFTESAQVGHAKWPLNAPYNTISDCSEPLGMNPSIVTQRPAPAQYIKVTTIRSHGLIVISFNIPEIKNQEIYLAPYTTDADGRERRLLPREFLNGGIKITRWACRTPQENPRIRIPFQYLPPECRQLVKQTP